MEGATGWHAIQTEVQQRWELSQIKSLAMKAPDGTYAEDFHALAKRLHWQIHNRRVQMQIWNRKMARSVIRSTV